MNIGNHYLNKRQMAIMAVLLIGLVVAVYLVQVKQIFESQASLTRQPLEISQGGSEPRSVVECNNDVCTTSSLDIFIKPKKPENQPNAPVEAQIIIPSSKKAIISVSWASCSFTRSGRSRPYTNTTLMGWLDSTARSEGIPPGILASFARHESEDLTTRGEDDSEITGNRYCNAGTIFCEKNGGVLDYRECTAQEIENGARTAKAMGLMQLVDIYNPGVDLCNIQQNIQRGAEVFKGKLGGGSFSDETSLKKAVCRYFGVDNNTCSYNGYDYAEEVWNDYQNCP